MSINNKRFEELFVEALKQNNLDKVRACITLGIDVNVRNISRQNDCALFWAMSWAIRGHGNEMLELFLAQPNIDVNVNISGENGVTALMVASASGAANIVQRLSQVPGIDFNAICKD